MKTPDEIKAALKCCTSNNCDGCPYYSNCYAVDELLYERLNADVRYYIQQLESEKWELFDLLSSAWYGKGAYFKQDDGTVYSRMSSEYLSFDQAIDEFARRLSPIEEVE